MHYYAHYVHADGDEPPRLSLSESELRALVQQWKREGDFELSFDDAHVSMMRAVEVLEPLGVRPTLFVPTGYVDTSPDFLTWDQVRELRDRGWHIGSHTISHLRMRWRLYDEDDKRHFDRLVRECVESKRTLERELGVDVTRFAYPFGEDTELARRAVAEAGYTEAFTVRPSMDWDGDRLAKPRVEVPESLPDTDTPTGISVVVPAYERAEILAEVVTRLASQTYPEDRYEVLVVDDGSESDLRPIFAEMPDNVRLLQPKGRDATFRAGQARQYGAEQARYDVLSFLDADVAVGADFLWHLDWVHRRNARSVVLGYLSGYNLHDLGFIHTLDHVRGADLDALSVIPDRSREPAFRSCLDNVQWLETPWELCYTGNLSLPKALLAEVGGFAEGFRGWGLEDVDLGVRLHNAGAQWILSRWALGIHLVDPSEPAPRNPFRKHAPTHDDFAGFVQNLERLGARHPSPTMQTFVERAHSDIAETCGQPTTVGIEMGGMASSRSAVHAQIHQVHPGGKPLHELLDRVAYAQKIGAQRIYLLGGAPAEHPDVWTLVEHARGEVSWVSMQTLVYPFAQDGLAAKAHARGLGGVDAIVYGMDRETHEAVAGPGTWDAFWRGWNALLESSLEVNVRLVLTEETKHHREALREALKDFDIVDETMVRVGT